MSDRIAVMNKGHYEQLADPETLYEHPATRFVAGFLGVSNLLPGRADGSADGHAIFRVADAAAIRVPRALADGRGSTISIGVRPEKIRLREPAEEVPGSLNQLRGVVRDASYIGVSTQYVIELRDGHRVTVYEQNVERATKSELWSRGEEVVLTWAPEHSFIVAEEPGASTADVDDDGAVAAAAPIAGSA